MGLFGLRKIAVKKMSGAAQGLGRRQVDERGEGPLWEEDTEGEWGRPV